jgi:hypothetical protein
VHIGELISRDDVKWVDMNTSVEEASMVGHTSLMWPQVFGTRH